MRQRHAGKSDGQQGYVLLALLVSSSILLAGLALTIPRMAMQSQRLKDERLIKRGEDYRRAITLYYREHYKYPEDLDDLEETDGVRYLRRRYGDPIGETGEWRLIHMGTDGRFEDSLLIDTAKDEQRPGSGQMSAGSTAIVSAPLGTQPQGYPGGAPGSPQLAPDPGGPWGGRPLTGAARARAIRESAAPDLARGTPYTQGFGFNPNQATSPENQRGEGPPDYSRMLPSQVPMDENERKFAEFNAATGQSGTNPGTSGAFGELGAAPQLPSGAPTAAAGSPGSMVQGSGAAEMINRLLTSPRPGGVAGVRPATAAVATVQVFERGIAGVASKSKDTGVKVYHGKQAYNEWEFVYDYRKDVGSNASQGMSQTPQVGQQPRQRIGTDSRGRPAR